MQQEGNAAETENQWDCEEQEKDKFWHVSQMKIETLKYGDQETVPVPAAGGTPVSPSVSLVGFCLCLSSKWS